MLAPPGITGGVVAMYGFQEKFFPAIFERTASGITDPSPYCVYDDQLLQFFSSCMFLAGGLLAWFVQTSLGKVWQGHFHAGKGKVLQKRWGRHLHPL